MGFVVLNLIFAILNLYFAFTTSMPLNIASFMIGLLNLAGAYVSYNRYIQSKE